MDPAVLQRLRHHPTLAGRGIADTAFGREHLVRSAEGIPDGWFRDGAAVGSAAACVARASAYRDAGADEILVHGASPAEATQFARSWRSAA